MVKKITAAEIQNYLSGMKLPRNLKKQAKLAIQNADLNNTRAAKAAEKKETENIIKNVAASVYRAHFFYRLELPQNNKGFSITDKILEHQGALTVSDSVWAPWSKQFNKNI